MICVCKSCNLWLPCADTIKFLIFAPSNFCDFRRLTYWRSLKLHILTLRHVCYNARWFWTTIRYGPMTTAYQCWTTGNGFSTWLIFIFKFLAYLSFRHGLFSFLSSLPISVLRNLELEANKLYDRANKLYKAALLTRCYVQHFLSPYIDSEVNHKRHFIKIPFINKGIEFIDLHSIFKDNSVISSIPNYFNNSETPIICYKYNKPIRSTIFNFNKIVNDLDIDSNTPAS